MSLPERAREVARHYCAQCLKPVDAVGYTGPASRGHVFGARCHGYWVRTHFATAELEDARRFWHFVDDVGKPWLSPAERKRRELAKEVAELRARKGTP